MTDDERKHRETLWFGAYTGQMALLWQQVTYVQLSAAAAFGGWYLAWDDKHWVLACLALLAGMLIQSLLILVIRRHAQIVTEFTRNLSDHKLIDQRPTLMALYSLSSHGIARLACAIFIVAGALGIVATASYQLCDPEKMAGLTIISAALILAAGMYTKRFLRMLIFGTDKPTRQGHTVQR